MDENTDHNRLLIDYMCPIISDDRLWFLVRLPITRSNWRCSIFICHRMRFSRSGLQVFQILYISAESLSNTSRTTRTTGTTRAKAR